MCGNSVFFEVQLLCIRRLHMVCSKGIHVNIQLKHYSGIWWDCHVKGKKLSQIMAKMYNDPPVCRACHVDTYMKWNAKATTIKKTVPKLCSHCVRAVARNCHALRCAQQKWEEGSGCCLTPPACPGQAQTPPLLSLHPPSFLNKWDIMMSGPASMAVISFIKQEAHRP